MLFRSELEEGLCRLLKPSRSQTDSTDFEERGLALFRPTIQQRLVRKRSQHRGRQFPPGAKVFGSLWLTPPSAEEGLNRTFFHIFNAAQPKSIFDDPDYLPRCLLTLMDQTQRDFGCDRLWTISWLNSYPPWQSLFPDPWRQDMGLEETVPHAGMQFWGQFVNARGTFNAKHAAQFRRTGRIP